jgi:predicted DNA-binding transcriptional regulator YafY
MSTNKHAFIRYKILDKCFSNPGRKYFIEDLIAECEKTLIERDPSSNGISRRQILQDISFMESKEGWSIDLGRYRDGKKVYYRYTDPSFSINNMPLNDVEVNQLKSALDILSQFKGMPQFEWIQELLTKLQQNITLKKSNNVIIEFSNNEYLKGIEHLGPLYNSILYKRTLKISYKPFISDSPLTIIIHPYYLKQYNNRWFLFGYNNETQKHNWNLALDRIQSIEEVDLVYVENTQINWSEYFDDIVGVTIPDNASVERVIFEVYGKTAFYLESKPIHGSQKSKWLNKETLLVELNVIPNIELEKVLLSFSGDIKVLAPNFLIDILKMKYDKSLSLIEQ